MSSLQKIKNILQSGYLKAILIIIIFVFGILLFIDQTIVPLFNVKKLEVITIENDEDFYLYTSLGNGSDQNPFILDGLKLGTSQRKLKESYRLISVTNTVSSFSITNCEFTGGFFCIFIEDISSGQILITNNSFTGIHHYSGLDTSFPTLAAISIDNSFCNVTIRNNKFTGKFQSCIDLDTTGNILMENNFCNFDRPPLALYVYGSQNLTLLNNIIKGEIKIVWVNSISFISNKISQAKSRFMSISEGKFSNNSFEAFSYFEFYQMQNFTFSGNNITHGLRGLQLNHCNYSTIKSNFFFNCSDYALTLNENTNNITIFHNAFIENNILGISQAFDNGYKNMWFNSILLEGNYWDNLGLNVTYEIDGTAGSIDLYPLSSSI
ncbi:MAG: hypothetical protein HeimAB125_10850 [Candidatus Heimdallarchaeota archaeon AB_125]|nr:MAG: hypothetical protein HeimAB125_10850 [Candidatus Heimdallarchaeota archaeon AB_125]